MYDYSFSTILLITLITFGILALFYKKHLSVVQKLVLVFSTASIFIYSGLGIAITTVDDKYIIYYVIYLFLFLGTIRFFMRKKEAIPENAGNTVDDLILNANPNIYKIATWVFFLTLLVNLFIPTVRISDLWNFSGVSDANIVAKRYARANNSIISIFDTVNLLAMPFFLMHLYNLIKANKKRRLVLLLLMWAYFDYLLVNYLSRYEIMVHILFMFMTCFMMTKDGIKKNLKKYIRILIILGIISVPLLIGFVDIRSGSSIQDRTYGDSFIDLFTSETYYPTYYSYIETNLASSISGIQFILWILCTPIPSVFWPGKPSVAVNIFFTTALTGLTYGNSGYSVTLPSILGESFIVFGMDFFWVHAIIMGTLIGLYFRYFDKVKSLSVLTVYQIIILLTLGRGGSSSYVSTLINETVMILVWILFNKIIAKSRPKSMSSIGEMQ